MSIKTENKKNDSKLSRQVTCIVCPVGCRLEVSIDADNVAVTGNKCPRGEAYAREEIKAPKRVVTATVQIAGAEDTVHRLPVKSFTPCPKEKIPALLEDIYKTKITLPVKTGDVIIADWQGLGLDVVATRSLE